MELQIRKLAELLESECSDIDNGVCIAGGIDKCPFGNQPCNTVTEEQWIEKLRNEPITFGDFHEN